jgi:hypothetical protein
MFFTKCVFILNQLINKNNNKDQYPSRVQTAIKIELNSSSSPSSKYLSLLIVVDLVVIVVVVVDDDDDWDNGFIEGDNVDIRG